MPARRSMAQVFLFGTIILVSVAAVAIGYFAIQQQITRFEREIAEREAFYTSRTQTYIHNEVKWVVDYVEFMRQDADDRLRDRLRSRLGEAYQLIDSVHTQVGADTSAFQSIVKGTLRQLQFSDGRGSFSIIDEQGNVLLAPHRPQMEGMNLFDRIDGNGRYIVRDIIALALQQGEGFIEFKDPPTAANSNRGERLGLVKYFAPAHLVILADEYQVDTEQRIQGEVLKSIANRRGDSASFTFILDSEGEPLFLNDNIAEFYSDLNAVNAERADKSTAPSLRKRLLKVSRQPSTHTLEYQSVQTGRRAFVVVERLPVWGWYVGAQISLDRIEGLVVNERENLLAQLRYDIGTIISIVLLCIFLAFFVGRHLARSAASGFTQFNDFFDKARSGGVSINNDALPYREFTQLASHANAMLHEREQAQNALQQSELRLRMALELSGYCLWELDAINKRIHFGSGFWRSLGYSQYENTWLAIEEFISLVHPADAELFTAAIEKKVVGFDVTGLEGRLRHVDGNYRWYLARGGEMSRRASGGGNYSAIGTVVEVTAQKTLEQELVSARNTADDASYAKSQFLSAMSHELHTPLNGVIGYVQILLRDPSLNSDQHGYLQAIKDSADQLLVMISDILNLAKIESGKITLHDDECDLRQLMQSVADACKRKALGKGLEYNTSMDPQLPGLILIDSRRLRQLLTNLIDSAVGYTDAGSISLEISLTDDEKHIVFSIIDTGITALQRDDAGLFSKNSSSAVAESAFLGFAVCRRIAQAMGGALEAKTHGNGHNTTRLQLPLKLSADKRRKIAMWVDDIPLIHHSLPGLKEIINAAVCGDIEIIQQWLDIQQRGADKKTGCWLNYLQRLLDGFELDALHDALVLAQGEK